MTTIMKKIIALFWDIITMPFVSVAILIHESLQENKEELIERKVGK